MNILMIHPTTDSISITHANGGIGMATRGYSDLLLRLGNQVTTVTRKRNARVDLDGLQEVITDSYDTIGDTVSELIKKNKYDIIFLVSMHWTIDAGKLNLDELSDYNLVVEVEADDHTVFNRVWSKFYGKNNVKFYGDRRSLAAEMSIPENQFWVMPVIYDFYNQDVKAPEIDKLLYAGRICNDKNVDAIVQNHGDYTDFRGFIPPMGRHKWVKIVGDVQPYSPSTFYAEEAYKYQACIRARNEPGVPYQNMESLMAGIPIALMVDTFTEFDHIYGPKISEREWLCAFNINGLSRSEIFELAHEANKRRPEIRAHVLDKFHYLKFSPTISELINF